MSQHLTVGYFSPANRFTSLSAAPVEHASLEAVYIFIDTATYNEIERDVKVTEIQFQLLNLYIAMHWRHDKS